MSQSQPSNTVPERRRLATTSHATTPVPRLLPARSIPIPSKSNRRRASDGGVMKAFEIFNTMHAKVRDIVFDLKDEDTHAISIEQAHRIRSKIRNFLYNGTAENEFRLIRGSLCYKDAMSKHALNIASLRRKIEYSFPELQVAEDAWAVDLFVKEVFQMDRNYKKAEPGWIHPINRNSSVSRDVNPLGRGGRRGRRRRCSDNPRVPLSIERGRNGEADETREGSNNDRNNFVDNTLRTDGEQMEVNRNQGDDSRRSRANGEIEISNIEQIDDLAQTNENNPIHTRTAGNHVGHSDINNRNNISSSDNINSSNNNNDRFVQNEDTLGTKVTGGSTNSSINRPLTYSNRPQNEGSLDFESTPHRVSENLLEDENDLAPTTVPPLQRTDETNRGDVGNIETTAAIVDDVDVDRLLSNPEFVNRLLSRMNSSQIRLHTMKTISGPKRVAMKKRETNARQNS